MHEKLFIILGAASAILTVLLGAAAAHTFTGMPAGAQAWFHTGLQYQQFHALGLLAVGLVAGRNDSRWLVASGWLMALGTLLFSGNLYLRSAVGFHALHAITPYGGFAFIFAWLALAIGVARQRSDGH
ncbi:MAG: DUF423 domain-containing protein [Rhodocyclaceae bacterium]|nr:DUF423 domain-containing protein [Rhodocyclaceae bacterium]